MALGKINTGEIHLEQLASATPLANMIALTKETGTDKVEVKNSAGNTETLFDTSDAATAVELETGTSAVKVLTPNSFYSSNHLRNKFGGRILAHYDFAIQGGSVGNVNLIRPDGTVVGDVVTIPDNTFITNAYCYVTTAVTSGGAATIGLGVASDDGLGLLAVTAYTDFLINTWVTLIPDGTAANFTNQATATRNIIMTIAGAALTAGKFTLILDTITTP